MPHLPCAAIRGVGPALSTLWPQGPVLSSATGSKGHWEEWHFSSPMQPMAVEGEVGSVLVLSCSPGLFMCNPTVEDMHS